MNNFSLNFAKSIRHRQLFVGKAVSLELETQKKLSLTTKDMSVEKLENFWD